MSELLQYMRRQLAGVYPDNEIRSLTRLVAEQVCGIPYHRLSVDKDKQFPEKEKREIVRIVERLKRSEPIQYIFGEAFFYDLAFRVGPPVLIPRPETEELVDRIVRQQTGRKIRLLDIGTGSGCIAVTLGKRLSGADVTAVDLSEAALAVAGDNATRHGVAVRLIRADILDAGNWNEIPGPYDVIVSNPPYVTESEKSAMERNVLDYEPALALFVPDDDPLRFYRAIARLGQQKLAPGGYLYFEINARYGAATAALLESEGYRPVRVVRDLSGKDRIVEAQRSGTPYPHPESPEPDRHE